MSFYPPPTLVERYIPPTKQANGDLLELVELRFDQLSSLAATCQDPGVCPPINLEHIKDRLDTQPEDQEWYGDMGFLSNKATVRGLGQALVDGQWTTGMRKLADLAASITDVRTSLVPVARKRCWGSEGEELDCDRLLARSEAPWVNFTRTGLRSSKVLTVIAGFGGNSLVSPETMFWSGAAGVVLTDALEDLGYRVRLIAAKSSWLGSVFRLGEDGQPVGSTRSASMVQSVILKEADEPLRYHPVAAVLCHAGYFRTIGFMHICMSRLQVSDGLGSSQPLDAKEAALVERGALLLPVATDRASCVASIAKAAEALASGSYLSV